MALTLTKDTIVASVSRAADAAATRGVLDVSADYGGIITMKITNGTAPTAQCEGRVLISHEVTIPAAASAGADWKTVYRFGGGIVLNAITEQSFEFGPEVRHVEVEFVGNTGQAVTVEAIATTFAV